MKRRRQKPSVSALRLKSWLRNLRKKRLINLRSKLPKPKWNVSALSRKRRSVGSKRKRESSSDLSRKSRRKRRL